MRNLIERTARFLLLALAVACLAPLGGMQARAQVDDRFPHLFAPQFYQQQQQLRPRPRIIHRAPPPAPRVERRRPAQPPPAPAGVVGGETPTPDNQYH